MIGQGGPFSFSRTNSAIDLIFSVLIGVWLCACAPQNVAFGFDEPITIQASYRESSAEPAELSQNDRVRLRLSWGGGDSRRWVGSISVSHGSFANVNALGLTADAVGAVVSVDGQLKINHWTATNYGGADVDLDFGAKSQIKIELAAADDASQPVVHTIDVASLLAGASNKELDATGNRLTIIRVPGDQLPVSIAREHLVFSPGEIFELGVRANRTELSSRTTNCRIKLNSPQQRGLGSKWSKTLKFHLDQDGSNDFQFVSIPLPTVEGVYDLQIELEPNWQQASFRSSSSISRHVQLVVIDRKPLQVNDAVPWRMLATIDPTDVGREPGLSLAQFSRLNMGVESRSLGNDLRRAVTIENQKMLELLPGGWQAIPMPVDQLNRPQLIEVEFVADQPTAIGMSLIQPDAGGQIPSYGFDSGVVVPKTIVEINPQSEGRFLHRHQLVFWPHDKRPYLLIANRSLSDSAIIGEIHVYSGPERLPEPETGARKNFTSHHSSREFLAFYESPLFPENFGARETVDPQLGQPLDDWQMFYEGTDRFIQYLKSNSYSGAFVTVASDGSSIYPSSILRPSPKHDTGTFFNNGQDPIRKDVLEMMFRMFEREGLTLVPALALSGPIPEMESARLAAEPGSDSFEMVNYHQTQATLVLKNHLPVYNPLNRRLQKIVTDVVAELSSRYRDNQSFGGLAIICRPDTYTLLPGRHWGYDSATMRQFLQTQNDLTAFPTTWPEIQSILLGSHQEQWIQWRAAQMSDWYQAMLQSLRQSVPNGELYLAPIDLYRNEELSSSLSPSLHTSADFRREMLQVGLDAGQFNAHGGMHLLKPQRVAPNQSLAANRVESGLANNRHADEFFKKANSPGELFTHRVSWAHFAQLQDQNPYGQQQSPIMRLQQLTPAGTWNRQRFLNGLRTSDCRLLIDGGWMLSMGQEEDLQELVRVFRQLPATQFTDVPLPPSLSKFSNSALPITVRQFQSDDQNWFYAVNSSLWPVKVTINATADLAGSSLVIESLSNQPIAVRDSSLENPGGQIRIQFEMPPLSLLGGVSGQQFSIDNYEFELPADSADRLRKQVYALQAKLVQSASVAPMDVLQNPDFESPDQPALAGWDIGQPSGNQIRINNGGYRGRSSLGMNNSDSNPVWIRSQAIEPPETGRISISVWLRTDTPDRQPPLRLAIEGNVGENNYYRFGSVGSLSPDPNSNQLSSQWQRFAVHFDDLPIDKLTNLRIGFDLMGAGNVQMDHVEVFDRWFDEQDAKAITQRLASCGPLLANAMTLESCRRLLEGYWLRFLDENFDTNFNGANEVTKPLEVPHQNEPVEKVVSKVASDEVSDSDSESDDENSKTLFRRFRRFGTNRR